jgi:CheY-like chemotaxis protein
VHMPGMGGMEATQAIRHLANEQRELWQQGNTNDP